MDLHDRQVLKTTPLFGNMADEVIDALTQHANTKTYEKGSVLFQQGETAKAFYVVLDGWVKIYRITKSGEEAIVGLFSRGESFAEAAIFDGGEYPASAEVVSQARLINIDGDLIRRMILDNPVLAMSMLASFSVHLKHLVFQLEKIKVLSASRRVADFLCRLCACHEGPCIVHLPYEKTLIANRLGMKPESFSRVISRLKPIGVCVTRECVSIDDVRILAKYAETGQPGPCNSKPASLQLDQ